MKSKIISHGDYVKANYGGSLIIRGTVIGTGCTGVTVAVNNERFFCLFAEILTIRKSRKGCAESRAIVAMLAREYRKIILHNYHVAISDNDAANFWKAVKKKTRFRTLVHRKIYEQAKAILK